MWRTRLVKPGVAPKSPSRVSLSNLSVLFEAARSSERMQSDMEGVVPQPDEMVDEQEKARERSDDVATYLGGAAGQECRPRQCQ